MANTLTHSPADIIRWLLVSLGLGSDPDEGAPWPVYAAGEPNAPDNVITVYDTAGTDDGRSMIDGEVMGHNGVQIRVRSTTHPVGYAKADAVWTALCEEVYDNTVTIDGVSYLVHSVNKIGDVLALGKEVPASKRSLFTINAVVSVRAVE
jgi:hypothetical protein